MLVLTRKVDETIIIDTGAEVIEVIALEFKGKQVRLGIKCGRNIKVDRKECTKKVSDGKV